MGLTERVTMGGMGASLIGLVVASATQAFGARLLAPGSCYERIYDGKHLAAHPGQFVRRIWIRAGDGSSMELRLWIKGRDAAFEGDGSCEAKGETLLCKPALSAADEIFCKGKRNGFTRCRRDIGGGAGVYVIAKHAEGIVASVRETLELLQARSDTGPYVYLSPDDRENNSFLLTPAAGAGCKS
jgi:hypothetical protein